MTPRRETGCRYHYYLSSGFKCNETNRHVLCIHHDSPILSSRFSRKKKILSSVVPVGLLQHWDLFVLSQDVVKDVEEDVDMVLFEDQCRTETDGQVPTSSQEHAFVSGL